MVPPLGVSSSVVALVLGLGPRSEQQVASGVTPVAVSVDLKNAHSSFSRTKCMGDPKAAATKTPALWPLEVAWHAMALQRDPIYTRGI